MPKQDCLICATDEGSFLDIFIHGRGFHDIIENYLSLEVQKNKLLSTKICYKCAYELTECNKFVEKFNQAQEEKKKKLSQQRGRCNLCSEPGKKGFIYDLQNDALDDVCERIQDLFNQNLSSPSKPFSVCLYCLYNLDVLSDLKKVAKINSTNDDTCSKLPKVNVNIIKRKTTSLPSPSFSDSSDIDTSTSKMSKKKSSKLSLPNDRQCDKCESKIENGINMYRFHNTGQNVCKECWVSMDPVKLAKGRKRNASAKSNTKLCTVVLNDVLTNPSTRKSKNLRNSMNLETTKMTTRGAVVYVISDDSETEQSPSKSKKGAKRAASENDTKSTKKVKRDVEIIPQRETRAMSVMSSVSSTSHSSRQPPKRRNSDNFEVPDAEPKRLRTRPSKVVNEPKAEKTDDEKTKKTVGKSKASVSAKSKTSKKPSPSKTVSSSDEGSKKSQKITKSSSQKSNESDSSSPSRSSSFSSSQKGKPQVGETPNVEGASRRSQRMRKPTKFWSETSESAELSDDDVQEIESESNKKSGKSEKTKARSANKTGKTSASKSRGKGVDGKGKDQDEGKADNDGDNQPYTCTICDTEFETKVEGMTHQLTHSKKLGVVLEKVSVSEDNQNDGEKAEKDENISTEVAEDKSIEDSAEATDASVIARDIEKSQNDKEDVDKNKAPETEASNETKTSEKSLESAKEPEEGTEVADNKETESEKLSDLDTSNENDEALRYEEEEAEESSKNDEANNPDEEIVEKKTEEKEESLMNVNKELSEKQIEEIGSQRSESDNQNCGRQSPLISEENTEGFEKEDLQQLTNGEDAEIPLSDPENGQNGKEKDKIHHVEERVEKIDGDKSEEKEEVEGDTEKVHRGSEQQVEPQEVEQNDDEDWESDEEKSPEAEPLSPPRRDESTNGDTEQLPEDEKREESQKKLMEENNGDDVGKVREFQSNSNGGKFQENHSKMGEVSGDLANLSEPVTQEPDVEINVDEASMDAIERQMETIVGGKDVRGERSQLNTGDSRQSAHMSLLSPTTVAAAGEQVS